MRFTTLTLFLVLIFDSSFSQEYSYKQVALDGVVVKIQGEVSLSDTLVQVISNGKKYDYPVEVVLKKDDFVQYRLKNNITGETQ